MQLCQQRQQQQLRQQQQQLKPFVYISYAHCSYRNLEALFSVFFFL
jgi:hypothetical protein